MDLPLLLAAVERGDDDAVLEALFDATSDELAGDDAVALLAAAARVGRQQVVDHLVLWGVDVTRPWDGGTDPVAWAAQNGRSLVLQALLSRNDDPLSSDSPHRRALRIARDTLASGAGREADPPPAHWAIVTDMEAALGVRHSPDELMARALVHADPHHDDWSVSVLHLGTRADQETFDWALEAARDTADADRRRFGIDTMDQLAFSYGLLPLPDDAVPPFAREAEDFLRPLLRSEQDPRTLALAIGAFATYNNAGDTVAAVLPHAYHADPRVRARVSMFLHTNTDRHQEAFAALVHLAGDSVPVTRANALSRLLMSDVDTPELRALFTAHLTDPSFDARLEAAAGLALRGDERGRAALDEIRSGIKNMNSPGWGRLGDIDYLLRKRVGATGTTLRDH
ncbi:hypothetical protein [Kitasatospora sp. NPDC088134]|uniref:hypothetical protein n=1 Tax=Kitasatospora sp. NPDC088134 TaxID=3364071 RepID=UPI0038052445